MDKNLAAQNKYALMIQARQMMVSANRIISLICG
jgi:hypothetical protein